VSNPKSKRSESKPKISSDNILFVVSAPSGTGKTTVVEEVISKDRMLAKTISHTTRSPRPNEIDGKDYYFVNEKIFRRMIKKGAFVEWASVYGQLYGTSYKTVEDILKSGKDVILVIEVQGARSIKRLCKNVVFILILPPDSHELSRRMVNRPGSKLESVAQRLAMAQEEARQMRWYDYLIVNHELGNTVDQLKVVIQAERLRLKRQHKNLSNFISQTLST